MNLNIGIVDVVKKIISLKYTYNRYSRKYKQIADIKKVNLVKEVNKS